MINILIADDHDLFRDGLKLIFKNEKNMTVVGEASNGKEAVKMARKGGVDVILMDISMPVMDGISATEEIISKKKKVKIIMLSMHNDIKMIRRVLDAGAHGYLLKDSSKSELIAGVNQVFIGKNYFGEEVKDLLITSLRADEFEEEVVLTSREEDILHLICEENTSAQIAEILCISSNTVESHRKSLLSKTGCKNSVGLVKFAMEHGLL